MMQRHQHKSYLDIIRILCIFFVVYNHTPLYHAPYSIPPLEINIFHLMANIGIKIAVPLFFMISGALLLDKEESLRKLFTHRIWRFVVVILLFCLIQCSFFWWKNDMEPSLKGYLTACFNPTRFSVGDLGGGKTRNLGAAAYWFLYAYLAFLIALPLLRSMARNMDFKCYVYLIGVQISLQCVIPVAYYIMFGMPPKIPLLQYTPLLTTPVLYPLLGYFLEKRVGITKVSWNVLGFIGCIAFVFILSSALLCIHAAGYVKCNIPDLPWFKGGILPLCIFAYLGIKKVFVNVTIGARVSGILSLMGGSVFMVMILDNIIRKSVATLFVNYERDILPSIYVVLITVLGGMIVGLIVKQIPWLKKIF